MSGGWDLGLETGIWVSGDRDLGIWGLGSGCPGTGIWSGDPDLGVGGLGFGYPGTVWKGLESPGGLWRGLGTPRSQDFEDVSSRLLDSGGPGTGRHTVVGVIMLDFGPLRNQYLGLRTRPQTTETLGQSYEDLKRPQARQNLKSTVHISTVLRPYPLSLVAPKGPADLSF